MAIAVLLLSEIAPGRELRVIGTAPGTIADVNIVLVPVTVTDLHGVTVTGLDQGRFTLLQDNLPQKILSFSSQSVPCSIGILVDAGAKDEQYDAARLAINAFLAAAEGRDERPSLRLAERAVPPAGAIRAGGGTALPDALYSGLSHMRSAHYRRRAILVISAGAHNHSHYSKAELLRAAMDSAVQIDTITIGQAPHRLSLLDELSEQTGGLHFRAASKTEIKEAAKAIGLALRNQYLLGYRPRPVQQPGKWYTIRVKVDAPKTNVYARNGYFAR